MALSRVRNAFEPMLRRVFHLYWRFSRGLTLGVRAVVLDEAGRVFLVKHSYVTGWHLPGGGVEPGETVLEALARELKEEGNIDIVDPPAFHGLYFNAADQRPRSCRAVCGARRSGRTRRRGRTRKSSRTASLRRTNCPPEPRRRTRARIAEVFPGRTRAPMVSETQR